MKTSWKWQAYIESDGTVHFKPFQESHFKHPGHKQLNLAYAQDA